MPVDLRSLLFGNDAAGAYADSPEEAIGQRILVIPTALTTRAAYDEALAWAEETFAALHVTWFLLHRFINPEGSREVVAKWRHEPPHLAIAAARLRHTAEILYVPGTCADYALSFWRLTGLDAHIQDAISRGAVILRQQYHLPATPAVPAAEAVQTISAPAHAGV
jgi:hypothetical protein